MTTSSAVDQKAASIPVITPASGGRWLAGFRNILGKELSDWFGTRLW